MTRGELRALAIILLALAALKLGFNPSPIGDLTRDEDAYYYQMARHVSQGDGLLASGSLYHWGLQVLPSPAFSYPLWPIVLGITGRFLDLTRAAALLPECLYLVSLVRTRRFFTTSGSFRMRPSLIVLWMRDVG